MVDNILKHDAAYIIKEAIRHSLPDAAVKRALTQCSFGRPVYLAAIGKAAWQMAAAAQAELGSGIKRGVVVTKYGHLMGALPGIEIIEAGHPTPDRNTVAGTEKILEMVNGLTAEDEVLFLVSGGGSALFEKPLVPLEELMDITRQLLASGADINEVNTIRKRLSAVKGGRFAQLCAPAKVTAILLSDVIGDRPDSIASGPAAQDCSTSEQALAIVKKYRLTLSGQALQLLNRETPRALQPVKTMITGSVRELCLAAANAAQEKGYSPMILTDCLTCEAREAGAFLASVAQYIQKNTDKPVAVIAGGETVVHLKGSGKGGRNQELALAAAQGIAGLDNIAVFSLGSDGTDGPTDAAGGMVDGTVSAELQQKGISIAAILEDNNAYYALQQCDGLIITGPTGTNVNDVAVALVRPNR